MELKKTLLMPKGTFEMRGNLAKKEPLIIEKWEKMNLYAELLKKNENHPTFFLHDGPPYANGNMHCGHMLNKILKDIIVREKAMEGFYTPFVPGWDTHGLPIENNIVKQGIDRKTTEVATFRNLCSDYALTQVDKQRSQIKRLGVIGDYAHPYLTLDSAYEATQIHIFGELALKGLIYKGFKPVYWSPSSETALAEAEIEYQDVTTPSIFVKFPVTDGKGVLYPNDNFVIWTTTPWTLPANLAVAVNPRFLYGLYETDQGRLVILCEKHQEVIEELSLSNVILLKTFTGKELEGVICSHPFIERDSIVILGDYVTSDTGTGCVHIAPGHGVDDYNIATPYGLPPLCPVDSKGYMTEDAGERLNGLFYLKANEVVLEILTEVGRLLKVKEITHSYPHDWRTHKPVIFRATPQWFCSISSIKPNLLKAIETIKWNPSWGQTRMKNMITDRGDWCISRQRIWGVPLPIIYNEDDTPIIDKEVFSHIEELVRTHGSTIFTTLTPTELLPLNYHNEHSPNNLFRKEKDIMDVWFDSGSSFLNASENRKLPFPADLYLEGSDQYRGWFNSSLILSVATKGVAPYKEILSHGFILDKDAKKMSKSQGNGLDPLKMCDIYGADILRLWTASTDYQADAKISEDIIKSTSEQYRKIRNTFKFMLANLDDDETSGFDNESMKPTLSYLDKLILAKLEYVTNLTILYYEKYDFANAMMIITNFMSNDLSSFYLDISKDALYCNAKNDNNRRAIQKTIYDCTITLMKLLAPVLSFTMEEVNDHLKKPLGPSVALLDMPSINHQYEEFYLEDLKSLFEFRGTILGALELARANSIIGPSSEASVTAKLKDYETLLSKFTTKELNSILGVSSFNYTVVTTDPSIDVTKHNGVKCDRCWNYFDEVTELEDGEHLCSRCLEGVKEHEGN